MGVLHQRVASLVKGTFQAGKGLFSQALDGFFPGHFAPWFGQVPLAGSGSHGCESQFSGTPFLPNPWVAHKKHGRKEAPEQLLRADRARRGSPKGTGAPPFKQ